MSLIDAKPALRAFFGGPDRPPGLLCHLLRERICAVPSGGEIFWATYYFRNEPLGQALVDAKERGVKVRLTLEADPRTEAVNHNLLQTLRDPGRLGKDIRGLSHSWPDNLRWKKPRLHIKLYYFSHPVPHVLVGTFNPSGNRPEDPAIIKAIGDQDRGHNVLVEMTDPILVAALRRHACLLHSGCHGPWERLLIRNNRRIERGDTRIYLFPRLRRNVIARLLSTLRAGTVVRIAISHLNEKKMVDTLIQLAERRIQIEIITHDTERRVPRWIEEQLGNTLAFYRYRHPEGLPMHNKFILIDAPRGKQILFGSMNLSERSLYANHELLVVSHNSSLYAAFAERWEQMMQEIQVMSP